MAQNSGIKVPFPTVQFGRDGHHPQLQAVELNSLEGPMLCHGEVRGAPASHCSQRKGEGRLRASGEETSLLSQGAKRREALSSSGQQGCDVWKGCSHFLKTINSVFEWEVHVA